MPNKSPQNPVVEWLHRIESGLLVFAILGMLGLAIAQIMLRNIFDSGFFWGEGALRALVLWVGLLGASIASRNNNHIAIDLLPRFLPPKISHRLCQINSLLTALVCGALAWFSYSFVRMEYEDSITIFANVPNWIVAAIMPAAFGIMSLRYLINSFCSKACDPQPLTPEEQDT